VGRSSLDCVLKEGRKAEQKKGPFFRISKGGASFLGGSQGGRFFFVLSKKGGSFDTEG